MHTLPHSVFPTLQQATANPRLCQRLQNTHRQVWVSCSWGHCSFLLSPGVHNVLFVFSKSLFPQSCLSSVIKFQWAPKSNYQGFSVPLPDPQVGKSVVGPRTFLTVQEFIFHNCFAVCGLSSQWLYVGVNGGLLQEGLCHRLCDSGLLNLEPLPMQQATVDL